jgi:hypothetical protein
VKELEDRREPRTGVDELLSNMFSDWFMMFEDRSLLCGCCHLILLQNVEKKLRNYYV